MSWAAALLKSERVDVKSLPYSHKMVRTSSMPMGRVKIEKKMEKTL